ncbi:uncharacterized protein K444DRAFT_549450 [Hyaloscypha bicolor E]|uniref:GAR domain-containing protein n=1 Tax=Hyaloscypha bicolor E TaxID=1095630 RepID=A0A2J6SFG7_9HELO|nr:uncharacterized protein K444DRAFT_549450 [Hyaloscypha bicolor E]PMD49496.1 hypothetical protein K444DRAFT_549450 [Hyaloscypha bicolor E]
MGDTPVFSSPVVPRIVPPSLHTRTPSRSPTRQRPVDDILADLTPATTLEAFKNPSGRLRASIENATPSEQAFGLQAALASKNIQEWVDELSNWSWPAEGGLLGFEVPPAKRRKLSSRTDGNTNQYEEDGTGTPEMNESEYVGGLFSKEVLRYEIRLDEITADMEELNVEEIKRQVLDTHFSAKSRPSSSASNAPMPSFLSSYTKMDDFTAIVTATVLQALPNLSRLMRLMDVWSIRLSVLRKVPPLLQALEDAEVALKSGWNTINNPGSQNGEDITLSRETFSVMREVLQDKVTSLGQNLDYMLDTLEGREDTLPESWLDRMETIEQDYGEWVVAGDRKVRQGEWAKMARARQEAEEARRLKEAVTAKATLSSSLMMKLEAFPEVDESPTAGRIGLRNGNSYDYSPPDSPPAAAISKHPSLRMQQSPPFSPSDPTGPLTPLEPPVFADLDVSPAPLSSPKKTSSDEQLQKQISTLLESIPARIRLTSELEANPFSTNTLQPKKIRRSITPSFRSTSSMSNYSTSSRAPTPSFTLAPAFSKTNHRSRTPGNPEIKLYHLSRSTGEAPIKLFVRLVGEHGERVMVRVGGGWADLGEYLKEYASHHGRRTAADNDRVEIQDLPPRVVSNSSSIATIRGNGRDSPVPRPQSVLERSIDRPGSSLNIRKTRKSVGESEYRANDIRNPSTPLPSIDRRSYETPPSAAGSEASSTSTGPSFRSSSRLSWTEEDSSLGLAGPKSKKVTISEKDQEWVESMKEKVRQASAEKEKRNKERESMKESQRKSSFGEMDKVGGTKRLFRKKGV